jgi:anti-sigma-K factor RskA
MISCLDADILAAALSVGSIDAADEATLQQHLSTCADCRRVAGEYLDTAARLPLALEPLRPSPELRGRLMRAVYAEAAEAGRRAAPQRAAPRWRHLWNAIPTARGFTVLAAAAVAVAIAVTSVSLSNRQGTPVSVPLAATTLAPAAHGQLVYDRGGSQGVLTVTGLPAPSALASGGGVYEVWLVHADGVPVPAAYLTQQPDGTWSAAVRGDIGSYALVAATVEPPGGSHTPSAARVLQATLSN